MPLRSVIFRFQNANTKAKCKCKGKCIGKWFLCPKCGIYLLNASSKRDFSISKCKYKGKMQMHRQKHMKMVYALNATFISWMPLWSVICQFQKANTKAKCKCKGKCIGKCFWCPKCGIYLLNAALKRIFSISEWKYKGKCKGKGKCIGKWFLCPNCGIYLLNAASKRDLSISEGKYKCKMQMKRQMHRKMLLMP